MTITPNLVIAGVAVYFLSLVITSVAMVLDYRRKGHLYLKDLLMSALLTFTPVLNTLVVLLLAYFWVDSHIDDDPLIWSRK